MGAYILELYSTMEIECVIVTYSEHIIYPIDSHFGVNSVIRLLMFVKIMNPMFHLASYPHIIKEARERFVHRSQIA